MKLTYLVNENKKKKENIQRELPKSRKEKTR
jgi:hypothetical protein